MEFGQVASVLLFPFLSPGQDEDGPVVTYREPAPLTTESKTLP